MWFPQETADLVTFTKEILNGNIHILCSVVFLALSLFCTWRKCLVKYFLIVIQNNSK